MTKHIDYPRKDVAWRDICNQSMLDQATASLFAWQQGLGQFGGLHLHPCWQEASVLTRGYQGQGLHLNGPIMAGGRTLFERTGDARWKTLVDDVARNIMLLQQPEGGFRHSSSEFEPAYGCLNSCPIQQGFAMMDLLEYAAWPHAEASVVSQVAEVFERFWTWFYDFFWKLGNAWVRPLPFDAFCGVTNQDLVIVAVLAKAQQLYGSKLFETVGMPVLETYLQPSYYHEQVGLFERGDNENFVERTGYYGIILSMLRHIHTYTQDVRLLVVHDNVTSHLFDAIHTGPDGLPHFAWGAETFLDDKTSIARWINFPMTVCVYPELFIAIENYLTRHPDAQRAAAFERVRNTYAAYTYADGTIPVALGGNELFQVVGKNAWHWYYLIHSLRDAIQSPRLVKQPCIHRQCGATTWKTAGALWAIEKNDQRVFTGFRHDAGGLYPGSDYDFRGLDLTILDLPDICESIRLLSE